MRFKIEIDCSNAAFEYAFDEVARILEDQAAKLRRWADNNPTPKWADTLRDINGNVVGKARTCYQVTSP